MGIRHASVEEIINVISVPENIQRKKIESMKKPVIKEMLAELMNSDDKGKPYSFREISEKEPDVAKRIINRLYEDYKDNPEKTLKHIIENFDRKAASIIEEFREKEREIEVMAGKLVKALNEDEGLKSDEENLRSAVGEYLSADMHIYSVTEWDSDKKSIVATASFFTGSMLLLAFLWLFDRYVGINKSDIWKVAIGVGIYISVVAPAVVYGYQFFRKLRLLNVLRKNPAILEKAGVIVNFVQKWFDSSRGCRIDTDELTEGPVSLKKLELYEEAFNVCNSYIDDWISAAIKKKAEA